MKRLGQVGTLGGPVVLMPQACLGDWSGHGGNTFHNDPDETDYEVACDLQTDDLVGKAEDGTLRYVSLFSETTAVDIVQCDGKYILAPTVLFKELSVTLAQFLATHDGKDCTTRVSVPLSNSLFPLMVMDAVWSGAEAENKEHLILSSFGSGDHTFSEVILIHENEEYWFWEVSSPF